MESNMNLEKVLERWKAMNTIDETQIPRELIRSSSLHSEFLEYYVFFKAKLAGAEKKFNKLMWIKRKYFRGELEQHELQQYGWSQWQGLKPSSSELNQLFDSDSDLNDLKEIVAAHKTAVQTLEYIIKQIQSRDWVLKSLIDYNKFSAGC